MKGFALAMVLLPLAASAATITVNTTADNTNAGDGHCTLREAIANVNAAADTTAGDCAAGTGAGDTIVFTMAMPAKIALRLGQLLIQMDVSIVNSAAGALQVDGRRSTRVFEIAAGTTSMLNLAIQNGFQTETTVNGDLIQAKGGGILVDANATLSMEGCLISYNVSLGVDDYAYGGGIYNNGTLTLVRSVLDANRVTWGGVSGQGVGPGTDAGAIYNGGTLSLTDCTLTRNRADGPVNYATAGAVDNYGVATLSRCTFKSNVTRARFQAYGGAIASFGDLTASHCTFTQNTAQADEEAEGGAIESQWDLSLTDCTVSGNRVIVTSSPLSGQDLGRGGGIDSFEGTNVLTNCVFSRNTVLVQYDGEADGGGFSNLGGPDTMAIVKGCTFSRNAVMTRTLAGTSTGGAIFGFDPLTVTGSTFSRNAVVSPRESDGGGVYLYDPGSTIVNSTFVGNRASSCGATHGCQAAGGGLYALDLASVVNCTFSGNTADQPSNYDAGGGAIGGYGEVALTNSIVSGSGTAGNCSPANDLLVTSGGHNISSDATCFTSGGADALNTNPRLAGLANNGGPTQTMALKPGSPAINGGDNAVCAADPVNGQDQRGFLRPGSGVTNCSIGAYEFSYGAPPSTYTPTATPTITPTPTTTPTPTITLTPTITPTPTVTFTATPSSCGDGVKNCSEQCDGSDLGGSTCASEGYTSGTLSCTPDCYLNTTGCSGPTVQVAQPLKTGQTLCDSGDSTALGFCPGSPPGQDGALRVGITRSYTDNGDGTITDNATGLMWEKTSRDGSIHDDYNSYYWDDAFSIKIAALNGGGGFAGYTDWRLPNVNELQSLVSYGGGVDAVFNTNCVAGCSVTTCSCTGRDYWSSTSNLGYLAWYVSFLDGTVDRDRKGFEHFEVRAVRGGLRAAPTATPAAGFTATPTITPGGPIDLCRDGPFCGDGVKNGREACDGNDLGGETCASLGYAGGTLLCNSGCRFDRSACSGRTNSMAQPLKTGQTQCDQGDFTDGPCPGWPPGQDGALQVGIARSYTDNGDGTITDNKTGLMWEKLSADGSIHDRFNAYHWHDAFTMKIAALNSGGGFAGHTDWRLPNVNELYSITGYGGGNPAFYTNCLPGCSVATCNCTWVFWSSTTAPDASQAFIVDSANLDFFFKAFSNTYGVRAVRSAW